MELPSKEQLLKMSLDEFVTIDGFSSLHVYRDESLDYWDGVRPVYRTVDSIEVSIEVGDTTYVISFDKELANG